MKLSRKIAGLNPAGGLSAVVVAAIALAAVGCHVDGGTPDRSPDDPRVADRTDVWPPRAVWVVRRTYSSPREIADLMEDIRQAGLNTVLFQVRGNATAWYRSDIEPFAYEYRDGDPGFDPLQVACEEAHLRGLSLHAWVNALPAWQDPARQGRPPEDPRQLYNARPEWFLYDQHGNREPIPADWYVSINPCLPEVREYLVSVFQEIVGNYPVDGLHLDYIRYPLDMAPRGADYPRDERTLALYRGATGRRPEDDAVAWTRWRTDQLTYLVRDIRRMMRRVRPEAQLTVAAAPDIGEAQRRYYQDAPAWLRHNLVDLVYVMNYTDDEELYRRRQESWRLSVGTLPVAPGIGAYRHEDPGVTIEQLALAERWGHGFSLFSERSLFGPREARERLEKIRPTLLAMRERSLARQAQQPAHPHHHGGTPMGADESHERPRHPYGVVP